MTGVPDEAVESVRSDWGDIFLVDGDDETQKLAT